MGLFQELHAVLIPTTNLAAARRWYSKVLELEAVRDLEDVLSVYRLNGTVHLCLYSVTSVLDNPLGKGPLATWRSADLDATRATLMSRGVECSAVAQSPYTPSFRTFHFRDLDANRLDVCEYGADWIP